MKYPVFSEMEIRMKTLFIIQLLPSNNKPHSEVGIGNNRYLPIYIRLKISQYQENRT